METYGLFLGLIDALFYATISAGITVLLLRDITGTQLTVATPEPAPSPVSIGDCTSGDLLGGMVLPHKHPVPAEQLQATLLAYFENTPAYTGWLSS